MHTPIKLLLVAVVTLFLGSGCLVQAYDPAYDGDWDQDQAWLNEELTSVDLGSPGKPDPTPWVENGDQNPGQPSPWQEIADGEPGKPDPTPWRAASDSNAGDDTARWTGVGGEPGKPDPTPWRSLKGEPGKPDPTPWMPDSDDGDQGSPWVKTSDQTKPDPTPWRTSLR